MGIVTGGLGTANGISSFFEGRKMQREAQSLIDQFKWQDLDNPYKDLQVSRLGADLQREEAGRTTATNVDALRGGGVRGIMGGLGRVQAQNTLLNRQIGADLDQQQKNIDYAVAQDDSRTRDMIENRQTNELAGYGQMMEVGRKTQQMGVAQTLSGLTQMGGAVAGGIEGAGDGGGLGGFITGSMGDPSGGGGSTGGNGGGNSGMGGGFNQYMFPQPSSDPYGSFGKTLDKYSTQSLSSQQGVSDWWNAGVGERKGFK
jgi:hypothetical protein